MAEIFQTLFYQPILNLLVFLYNIIPGNDIGVAIIALTALIRLVLFPLNQQSIKSQKALQDIQPKIEELKRQYGSNKQELGKAMMELYKEQKVNPFSSCLPLLIQFPFLIAVFYVFRDGLTGGSLDLVYSFIKRPDAINVITLGFFDLSKPSPILAILAGLAQFWQAKMMMAKRPPKQLQGKPGAKDEDMMAIMNKQMIYFMPAITVFIGLTFPGGLTLYWLTTTLLMGLQQLYIFKKDKKDKEAVVEVMDK
ncbi:MAG: YidC/Oxa1 family membrane protein insertase [Patescibacteria group bacterium]|jgi:YidC/Oxa1 family membrane protein insertase